MVITLNLVLIFIIVYVCSVLLSSAILFGISKLFKIQGITYKKSIVVTFNSYFFSTLIAIIFILTGFTLLASLISLIVSYLIFKYFYKKYYQVSWGKSLSLYITNIVAWLIIILFVILPIRFSLIEPFVVSGQSMSPNLNKGDYIFIGKYDRSYERDNIVVFSVPNSEAYLVKRIVGLPRETVDIKDGSIFIDGVLLSDKYISTPISGNTNVILKSDEFFVLSDNSAPSRDSRIFGPIKDQQVIGKVIGK